MSLSSSSSSSVFRGLIVYGSQTGNAEEIAKSIRDDWRERSSGHPIIIDFFCMNDYVAKDKELEGLKSYRLLLLICSTTGNGDQPDNAIRFFRALKKKKLEKNFLAGIRVAILGLGDSNYDKFNESGRVLDQLCQQMGGEMITPKALADDGLGLEIVVEPFKKKFIEIAIKLLKEHSLSSSSCTTSPALAPSNVESGGVQNKTHNSAPAALALTSHVMEEKKVVDAATVAKEELEQRANDVVDSEKKIRVKIDQPAFMARIPKCSCTVKFHTNSASSPSSFLTSRFQRIDSEAELRGYTPEAPSLAAISAAKFLTSDAAHGDPHNRMVIHLELQLPLSSPALRINFSPGDSIGIYVANDEVLVQKLLQRLEYKGTEIISTLEKEKKKSETAPADAVIGDGKSKPSEKHEEKEAGVGSGEGGSVGLSHSHLVSGATLRDIFLHCVDITSPPKKAFLRMLSEYCQDEKEKAQLYHLLSREGFKEYSDMAFIQQANLLDVLELFPSCRPALAHLLDQLPPLLPRYYSITNSPLVTPAAIHIAFSVVQYGSTVKALNGQTSYKVRRGVASAHLWKLATGAGMLPRASLDNIPVSDSLTSNGPSVPGTIRGADGRLSVPIFLRRSVDFSVPEDVGRPLILIGPGTGVCPFRAFLQHRRQQYQAISSSGGRTSGWWRGLEMELGEEKEEEEESPLKIPNPRMPPSGHAPLQPHTQHSNHSALTVPVSSANGNSNVSRSHSAPDLAAVHSAGTHMSESSGSASRLREASDVEQRKTHADERFGSIYLFFGCRDRHIDFLYEKEWQTFLDDNTLTALYTAFSRETQAKYYVTHAMNAQAALLTQLILSDHAFIYVCGDGANMSKDVQRCFEDIISRHENGRLKQENFVDAAQYIMHLMKNEKRYRQDIWS